MTTQARKRAANGTGAAKLKRGRKLPPIPEYVELPAGPIRVIRTSALGRKDTFGCIDYERRLIKVRASLGPTAAWLTLEHELVHAILMDAGVTATLAEPIEEQVCDAIALARVHAMRLLR